jgi:hypothetical protein
MASDEQFNKKSFTTGHTGFGIPFTTVPDRSDVPRSAARALRYMERYVTVTQGEVFYMTEAMAQIEGFERGPAGNTSLAAAFSIAKEMDEDQIIVVQETEYTGAGKHIQPQLSFARDNGIDIRFGDIEEQVPGKNIIFPKTPDHIKAKDLDLDRIRKSYLRKAVDGFKIVNKDDLKYLSEEVNASESYVTKYLKTLDIEIVEG